MTNENVTDLSYADTLWKAADALRGCSSARIVRSLKTRRVLV